MSANSTCVTCPRLYISLPFHIVHHVVSRSGQRRMKVAEQSGLVYNWYWRRMTRLCTQTSRQSRRTSSSCTSLLSIFSPTRGEEARGQQHETNRTSNLTFAPMVLGACPARGLVISGQAPILTCHLELHCTALTRAICSYELFHYHFSPHC